MPARFAEPATTLQALVAELAQAHARISGSSLEPLSAAALLDAARLAEDREAVVSDAVGNLVDLARRLESPAPLMPVLVERIRDAARKSEKDRNKRREILYEPSSMDRVAITDPNPDPDSEALLAKLEPARRAAIDAFGLVGLKEEYDRNLQIQPKSIRSDVYEEVARQLRAYEIAILANGPLPKPLLEHTRQKVKAAKDWAREFHERRYEIRRLLRRKNLAVVVIEGLRDVFSRLLFQRVAVVATALALVATLFVTHPGCDGLRGWWLATPVASSSASSLGTDSHARRHVVARPTATTTPAQTPGAPSTRSFPKASSTTSDLDDWNSIWSATFDGREVRGFFGFSRGHLTPKRPIWQARSDGTISGDFPFSRMGFERYVGQGCNGVTRRDRLLLVCVSPGLSGQKVIFLGWLERQGPHIYAAGNAWVHEGARDTTGAVETWCVGPSGCPLMPNWFLLDDGSALDDIAFLCAGRNTEPCNEVLSIGEYPDREDAIAVSDTLRSMRPRLPGER